MGGGGARIAPISTVGFVGVGSIGRPICLNIAKGGFRVVAYDASPEARARLEGTPVEITGSLAEVAQAAEVCVLSLPNSGVVEEVVFGEGGLVEGLSEGDVVVDTSSSRPSSTREVARRLAEKGVGMLDAPVSGGVARAEMGDLTVMAGGEPEVFDRCRALLEAFGGAVFYVGESGAGHMAKALNNLVTATTMASAAEAVLLGERAGLDPEKLVEIINSSSGRSASTEVKFPRYVLNRAFEDGFAIGLMNKDVRIALDAASELGFPTVMGSAVGQVWQAAVAQGFGEKGHTAIYEFLEEFTRDGKKEPVEGRAPVATQEEKQAYVDDMARERGYVMDFHKVMAEHDFDALQATNNLVEAAYLKERRLDRGTKELIFIVSLTVMRASKGHIASHIRVALDLGLSKEEVLEAMEIAIPEAGIVAFQAGFEAWREVTGASGIEPSVEVFEGGSGSDG